MFYQTEPLCLFVYRVFGILETTVFLQHCTETEIWHVNRKTPTRDGMAG